MIYTIGFILYILTAHFVSDFIMQTDEMAKGKSTSIYWLNRHILSYGSTLAYFLIFNNIVLLLNGVYDPNVYVLGLTYVIINMGLHWVTDYFTSKQTSRLWAEQKVHDFFVMIGLDQLIHATCLIITFCLLFSQYDIF